MDYPRFPTKLGTVLRECICFCSPMVVYCDDGSDWSKTVIKVASSSGIFSVDWPSLDLDELRRMDKRLFPKDVTAVYEAIREGLKAHMRIVWSPENGLVLSKTGHPNLVRVSFVFDSIHGFEVDCITQKNVGELETKSVSTALRQLGY